MIKYFEVELTRQDAWNLETRLPTEFKLVYNESVVTEGGNLTYRRKDDGNYKLEQLRNWKEQYCPNAIIRHITQAGFDYDRNK